MHSTFLRLTEPHAAAVALQGGTNGFCHLKPEGRLRSLFGSTDGESAFFCLYKLHVFGVVFAIIVGTQYLVFYLFFLDEQVAYIVLV